jgi:hypothetical protein
MEFSKEVIRRYRIIRNGSNREMTRLLKHNLGVLTRFDQSRELAQELLQLPEEQDCWELVFEPFLLTNRQKELCKSVLQNWKLGCGPKYAHLEIIGKSRDITQPIDDSEETLEKIRLYILEHHLEDFFCAEISVFDYAILIWVNEGIYLTDPRLIELQKEFFLPSGIIRRYEPVEITPLNIARSLYRLYSVFTVDPEIFDLLNLNDFRISPTERAFVKALGQKPDNIWDLILEPLGPIEDPQAMIEIVTTTV